MHLILLVALVTLLASFLCSLFEAALYSVTPAQVELQKQRGSAGAARLERLRADIEEPIAAILTINTVAHTIGAASCGAMVGALYGDEAVALFAGVFTVAVLVLTEIIPKSIGVRWAPALGPRLAWPLQVMTWLSWPVARPTRAAMRWLTGGDAKGPSEEEVMVLARLASRHGGVRREEHRWVRNALLLDRVKAKDVMTPRRVIERLPVTMTVADAIATPDRWVHSRVPVFDPAKPDDLVGIVYRREVFDAAVKGQTRRSLAEFRQPLDAVPEGTPAHELLRTFLHRRRHLLAVVDEYGTIEGLVTLEDVLETMLGEEIVDEHDRVVDLQEHARQSNPHAGLGNPPSGSG